MKMFVHFLIYNFAPDSIWIYLYMRKMLYSFYQCIHFHHLCLQVVISSGRIKLLALSNVNSLHCKCTVPKFETFMHLGPIFIFPRSVRKRKIGGPIVGILKSLTDSKAWDIFIMVIGTCIRTFSTESTCKVNVFLRWLSLSWIYIHVGLSVRWKVTKCYSTLLSVSWMPLCKTVKIYTSTEYALKFYSRWRRQRKN